MRFLFPIVAFFVFLTGLVYMARNAQPVFFWGYLVAAPALLAALIDVVQRGMSVERLPYLYSGYLYRSVATLFWSCCRFRSSSCSARSACSRFS